MPGDLLDLILIVMIAAFAVAGYRQGFIIGALSLAGFIGGAAGGALIAPAISRGLSSSLSMQAFFAVLVVFCAAAVGMLIASAIGVAVRSRLTGRPATVLDSVGGAAVNVVALLIVAWLIGSFVANAPFPAISRQINDSLVLRAVDGVMPRSALTIPVIPPLETMLAHGIDEPVFSELGAATSPDLPTPNRAVLNSPALGRDSASIVKIIGFAPSCQTSIEGSGFVISPHHVLTNAHVVAGVTQGPVVHTSYGAAYRAHVVLYDPQRDLAVLDVPHLTARPLQFAPAAKAPDSAIVAGYPLDHGFTARPATVGNQMLANGPNIYDTGFINRWIYPVKALIQPGNSGGPLLAPDGKVYGVVFAASTTFPDVGYALTSSEVGGDASAGSGAQSSVSTRGCQAE